MFLKPNGKEWGFQLPGMYKTLVNDSKKLPFPSLVTGEPSAVVQLAELPKVYASGSPCGGGGCFGPC